MDQDSQPRPGASGRIPADAPGAERLAPLPEDQDDAALDRFWLGVHARLERGFAWTLISVSATILLGYGAWEFVAGFLGDAAVPIAVRLGTAGLALGVLLLLLGAVRERIRALSRDPFRRIRR